MSILRLMLPERIVGKWMLLAVPLMFILGGITHFTYKWSGERLVAAIFSPVNESVWEHLKMSFWVPLAWWLITYFALYRRYDIPADRWFAACAAALYTSAIFITAFYYTYTGALGIESLAIDIFSFLAGLVVAQAMAYHVYKYAEIRQGCLRVSIIAIAILAAAFIIFTFYPPQLPLFEDPVTGTYGIEI